jgi:CubicO group peptidase (beta-lactamase class C family)
MTVLTTSTSAAEIVSLLVARGVATHGAAGCLRLFEDGARVEVGGAISTYFDLASLTKPMTAVAIARSGIAPGLALGALLPELSSSRSAEASVELLLSHRAGLAAHLPLFLPLLSGAPVERSGAVRSAADARRDDCAGPIPPDGFAPLYSDLGYLLAGELLARHAGTVDAGQAIEEHVVAPLGLSLELGTARALSALGVDLRIRAAPTEDVAWRGGIVHGCVHDENAWALTGTGGSGHAGMFGTVSGVLRFAGAVLLAFAGQGPFASGGLDWLTRPRPGGTLRAGFDGKSDHGSSAGASFGADAIGHLGFTGTSLWIDPSARIAVVLLTNRVHPSRENTAIRALRPAAHDALFRRALAL